MTRKHVLSIFSILIHLLSLSCLAQASMAESMASVNPAKGLTEVTIEYKLDFLTTEAEQQNSDVNSRLGKSALAESELENEIRKVFSQNEKLYMKADYPEYILDIVALIKGKKKKEKALQIYTDHNQSDDIIMSRSSGLSMNEGKITSNTITIKFTVHVQVKEKTRVVIPAYTLESTGKIFQTRELVIGL